MKPKAACILLVVLTVLSSACIAADKAAFYPPQTEAEHALDGILARDRQGDADMIGYLVQYSERDKSKDANYTAFFTNGFVKAVSAFEKKLVDTQCDGKYTGELCGHDASYISCGQDTPDEYLYQTEQANDKEATIAAIWSPEYTESIKYKSTHRLLKQNGRWKLDGVACANGQSFNFKSRSFLPALDDK